MIPKRSPERKDLFGEVANAEGLDFLKIQLEAIETKIKNRRDHLEQFYPDGERLPEGEEELMQVYQKEKALIEELIREGQQKPIADVYRQRLMAAQRRLLELSSRRFDGPAARSKYWQAETEMEILTESLREWFDWIDGRTP